MLPMLEWDMDLEVQTDLIEDTVARLKKVVEGFLRRSLEVSACQACTAAQWSQLTASGKRGKYLIRTGEAVTEDRGHLRRGHGRGQVNPKLLQQAAGQDKAQR